MKVVAGLQVNSLLARAASCIQPPASSFAVLSQQIKPFSKSTKREKGETKGHEITEITAMINYRVK